MLLETSPREIKALLELRVKGKCIVTEVPTRKDQLIKHNKFKISLCYT